MYLAHGPRVGRLDAQVNKGEIPGRQWGDIRKSILITELPFVSIGKTANVSRIMVDAGTVNTPDVRSPGRERRDSSSSASGISARQPVWHRGSSERVEALQLANTNTQPVFRQWLPGTLCHPYQCHTDKWLHLHKGQHREFPQPSYVSGALPHAISNRHNKHNSPVKRGLEEHHITSPYTLHAKLTARTPVPAIPPQVFLHAGCFTAHTSTDVVLDCTMPQPPRSPDLNHTNLYLLGHT